jgi:hypothetical protein
MDSPVDATVWAVIDGDIVVNTIIWSGDTELSSLSEFVLESLEDWPNVGIGWTYNPKATVNKFVDNRPKDDV